MSRISGDFNPHLMRSLSINSQEAVGELSQFAAEYNELVDATDEIENDFRTGGLTGHQARDRLAQCESKLNKLQEDKVDAIETSDLATGKQDAKLMR